MSLKDKLSGIAETVKESMGLGAKEMVGLDVGLHSIKVAKLKKDGSTYLLESYASVALPEAALIEDEIQKEEEIVEAIEKAMKKSKCSAMAICLGLSGPNTVARKLQLAGGTEEEIEDQVAWEAEQYLPFPVDESAVSSFTVGENAGGGVDVIVAAARSDVLEAFRDLAESGGQKVKVVDLGVLAVCNVFDLIIQDKIEDPDASYIVMDFGAQKTEFFIYKNDILSFHKEMTIGGVMITEEIQRQMGVNYHEAEDLKITGNEEGNLPEEIVEIIDDVLNAFYAEIKKTVDFYISSTSDENFADCYITGGASLTPGLVEGLQEILGIEVKLLDPFDIINVNRKKFSDEELHEITYQGVAAIGLGIRKMN